MCPLQDSPETPLIRAERYRLREWLSTNIPIQWGKRLQRIESGDSGVTAWFEDGTSAKGDMLVGADGIQSIGTRMKVFFFQEPVIVTSMTYACLLIRAWADINSRKQNSATKSAPPLSK